MGLGRLLQTRSTQITSTDTVSGISATYFIQDNIGPDWAMQGPWQGKMGIPGAWRASILLSDLLGQVPWDAWRDSSTEDVEEMIRPRPPLLEQPAPPDTAMTTFSSWGLDLIWEGNAVGLVAATNSQGWPTAVVPVPARTVGVRRVGLWDDSPLNPGEVEYSVGQMAGLSWRDVIHVKGPCEPGALRGMGVLEAQLAGLNLINEQERQARAVVTTAGVPTGVLQSDDPDLDDDEAAELKAKWMANQASRTVAVLNAHTKFEPLSWNPEEQQLIEARKFSLTQLELMFGLPLGWLGGQTSSRTYANIEADAINLLRFSLGGHLGRFEDTLSLHFPRGTKVRANLDSLLRPDTKARYEAHQIGITAGFLTKDEARQIERRKPLPKEQEPKPGDEFSSNPADAAVVEKAGDKPVKL